MKAKTKTIIYMLAALFMTVMLSGMTVHAAGAKTGADVVKNAFAMSDYVYWYGGSGQQCTQELLNSLARLYPNIYTATYKAKCQADIAAGKHCIDCSGFVCKASGLPHYSTYAMATSNAFYEGSLYTPKNGMIVWTWTHCGIYYDGKVIEGTSTAKVIEARGVDSDIRSDRIYNAANWQRAYYVVGIDYDSTTTTVTTTHTPAEYLTIAALVCQGKLGNGTARVAAIRAMGYDADRVQKLVNMAIRGY